MSNKKSRTKSKPFSDTGNLYGETRRIDLETFHREFQEILDSRLPEASNVYPLAIDLKNGMYNIDLVYRDSERKIYAQIRVILIRNHSIELRWIHANPLDENGKNRNIRHRCQWYENAHKDVALRLYSKIEALKRPMPSTENARQLTEDELALLRGVGVKPTHEQV